MVHKIRGFPGGVGECHHSVVVKNLLVNAADIRDAGLIPGLGGFPGGGHGSPLQYSCLENPMGRGAWWATVHEVAKESDTPERLNNSTISFT